MDDFPWIWKRHPKNPILPAVPGTWMESQTANPDIALYDGVYHLYFRGQEGGHDRIGSMRRIFTSNHEKNRTYSRFPFILHYS